MIRDWLLIILDTTTTVKKHIVKVSTHIAHSLLPTIRHDQASNITSHQQS